MSHDALPGDPRRRRRNMLGFGAGALTGATLGALLAPWLPGLSVVQGAVAGGLVGAVAGALAGRALVGAVSPDDWEPGASRRSHVGARAPDDDLGSA